MPPSPISNPRGTVFGGCVISPLACNPASAPAKAKNRTSVPAPSDESDGHSVIDRKSVSMAKSPTATSSSRGTSLATVLSASSLRPARTPVTLTQARKPHSATMTIPRGTGSARVGSATAIVSTMATVMAASESTDQPNQISTEAMNPANGPKASSM